MTTRVKDATLSAKGYRQITALSSAVTFGTAFSDITVLATAQLSSTFTMTATRLLPGGNISQTTGAITADAVDATTAANIQTAVRAMGGIYADATCVAGTADTYVITVLGGSNVTWATTATTPTITEAGTAGGVVAIPGGIPQGARFALLKCTAQAVRWRDDGTAPTATVGMLIDVGDEFWYTGALASLQVIQATASAVLDIVFYA